MSIAKKTLLITIILILTALSGCTYFKKTEFKLISTEVVDHQGFPTIIINFNSSDKITLKLDNPENRNIFSDFFYRGGNSIAIELSDFEQTPLKGNYTLKAYDENDDIVYKKKLEYEGAKLKIDKISTKWWEEDTSLSLVQLDLTVNNYGDLPGYVNEIRVSSDSKVNRGLVIPKVVLPGFSEIIKSFVYVKNFEISETKIEVQLKDLNSNLIDSFSKNVIPSKNITDLSYYWKYNGFNNIEIPDIDFLYDYYKSIDRIITEDYTAYIFDKYDNEYIELLATKLGPSIESYVTTEKINYIANFVQKLEYAEDIENGSECEYPKYPIEMLKDKKGDCEDKAMLAASLLNVFGYNVSLLRLPNHMAVGVHLEKEEINYYDYFIDEYYYLETTRDRWVLGRIPDEYKEIEEVEIHPLSPRPIILHNWDNATRFTGSDGSDFIKMKIIIENHGITDANNLKVAGAFFDNLNNSYNEKTTYVSVVEAHKKKFITIQLDVPQGFISTLKTRIYLDNELVHEKLSTDTFP